MEKFSAGEFVKGPSFVDPDRNLIDAQLFVMETDFDSTILAFEERLTADADNESGHLLSAEHQMAQDIFAVNGPLKHKLNDAKNLSGYHPNDRTMEAPIPINPRLFPDLYHGCGDAICTHTKREVLKMRLLAILLNKLGSNYMKRAQETNDNLFTVQMQGKSIPKPGDFLQALIESGHTIEVFPTSRLTTFGVALCLKEPDDTWTNIPLRVFLESGYENKEGRPAPAMMPHSGIDLALSGT
jgi:hypothetical protein